MIKIGIMVKCVFIDSNSNNYLESLSKYYFNIYKSFLDDIENDISNIPEKSKSNINITNMGNSFIGNNNNYDGKNFFIKLL